MTVTGADTAGVGAPAPGIWAGAATACTGARLGGVTGSEGSGAPDVGVPAAGAGLGEPPVVPGMTGPACQGHHSELFTTEPMAFPTDIGDHAAVLMLHWEAAPLY